ncbi:hypothetical protein BPAE_0075g00190 [Botrytis paeoniae]|uniref:AMP-dependent synthetase/ligase domain-containing protein n=1 Tax=Botrytis paeoniae TaxID=278948 RepID=A0A4Z1FLF0_9HELO|nr:hypothetical protein BPAE_0075g00190 [Botrytis paeoniae]
MLPNLIMSSQPETKTKATVFSPRMSRKPPFTAEVQGIPQVSGETIPRRNVRYPDLLSQPELGIDTVFDIIQQSSRHFGDARALGSRKLIKKHEETKKIKKIINGQTQEVDKTWTYFEMSGYEYLSFKEYEATVLSVGAGLRKLGLVKDDRVHLFATTSAHWLSIAHGSMSQSMPIVTAYDTLGVEGLRHSLIQTKAKAIFLEPQLLKTLLDSLEDLNHIEYVIYNTDGDTELSLSSIKELKKSHSHLTLLSYDELIDLGHLHPVEAVPPKTEDPCCIMYTSGSSGTPKGVSLKHKNVVAAIAGANSIVGDYLGPSDTLLAYLPLAHIFEFVFENACLYWGALMGYGHPRTLSETSMKNCKGDILELKPTLLVGVPSVWEMVKKGVIANVNKGGPVVRSLFWSAFYSKRLLSSSGLPGSSILNTVVFNKVKQATGGRLRFCMNGAGPISQQTQEFISHTITPMISGYGSTETTAMGAICDPLSFTLQAGDIPACIEIKLVDFPDAGYFATDTPPQGEIWIRGPSVMSEYYDNVVETAEALTSDGWFKTEDIGEWDKNGHLKIIDRKKNLVKTMNGEYIALEKLESVYRSATVLANICIYASISETHPIAIVVPAEPALKKLAESIGVEGHGIGDLVHNESINREVLKQMQAVGKRAGLAGMEIIKGVVLADEEWTIVNKLVTATMKLNRKAIFERYEKDINVAYGK